jgi:poly-gamma-glutamate capsule biosynthesis protein CapA/YwtB (metallophosphatase superfamily)
MAQKSQQPRVETPADVALAEDYARLRGAFREAVAHEGAELPSSGEPDAALELERVLQERDRLRRELDVVLVSPTWRAGRAVTALPRLVRDRRST